MMPLFVLVLLPVIIAVIAFLIPLKMAKRLVILLQLIMIFLASITFHQVKTNGTIVQTLGGWDAIIGIALKADSLSTVIIMLSTLLFLAMVLFDFHKDYLNNLFLCLFMLLQGLIIGILLSGDLFNIFVLVEVSTVLVSILIMFKRDSQAIYDGLLYFLLNTVAMAFFLFGVGILYKITGVLNMDAIEESILLLENPHSLILPYTFIMMAICFKSAVVPLFSWLPKAHGTASAPGVVSAVLSGLYVKIGLYLFLRIREVFGPQIHSDELFLFLGLITALTGFILAISQDDIKLILAYSTISQIGLIIMALSMGTFEAYWGGIYHIINHAVFKSILFMSAGAIVTEYKTRNIHEIRGLIKRMPYVTVAVILAVLGITGAPFFNGSISKYWISYGAQDSLAEFALLGINLGTIIIFLKFTSIFYGISSREEIKVDTLSRYTAVVMGLICFIGGIFGQQFITFLFGYQLPIDPVSYLYKMLTFLLTLLVAFIIYHTVVKKLRILHTIRKIEMSFNGACIAMGLFFGFIIIFLRLTI